jgi:hypothetical protein
MNEHEHHVTTGPAAHEHHRSALPFTDADWKEFEKSDKGAGGAVVVLMGAIFSIGLVLYSVIAYLALLS